MWAGFATADKRHRDVRAPQTPPPPSTALVLPRCCCLPVPSNEGCGSRPHERPIGCTAATHDMTDGEKGGCNGWRERGMRRMARTADVTHGGCDARRTRRTVDATDGENGGCDARRERGMRRTADATHGECDARPAPTNAMAQRRMANAMDAERPATDATDSRYDPT